MKSAPAEYMTGQVAAMIGCHRWTVVRAAKRSGVGRLIGSAMIFTDADVAALRGLIRENSGNPNFVEGNELWRAGGRTKKKPE